MLSQCHITNISGIQDQKSSQKIQLALKIIFIYTEDTGEECNRHKKSKNITIMVGNLTNESLKITFASVLSECQDKLSKK